MNKILSFAIVCLLLHSSGFTAFSQKVGKRDVNTRKSEVSGDFRTSGLKLADLEAFSDGNGVYLRWRTEYESKNLGFYVHRTGGGSAEQVSRSLIAGGHLQSSEPVAYGREYSFFDPHGNADSGYYLKSLDVNGQTRNLGKVVPQMVKDISRVAGSSSEELSEKAAKGLSAVEIEENDYPAELGKQFAENVLPPDSSMQRWVAAQPGVKIGVRQEGIYRVSRAELQAAGFNVGAPGHLWQLFVDGREQSIIVGTGDSYIEFYGKGIDTLESGTKVYYLIVGSGPGKRIAPAIIRQMTSTVAVNSYQQAFTRKERSLYISTVLNGEAENFYGSLPIIGNAANPVTYTFSLSGIDYSAPTSRLELGLQGLTIGIHQIQATLNGQALEMMTGMGITLMRGELDVPTSLLQEGTNTLQLRAFNGSSDISVLESIKIGFLRKYAASQNRLSFYTHNYRRTTLTGFTSPGIRVFDLTYPDSATLVSNLRIENNNGSYTVQLPANRGRVMYALEDSAVLQASSVAPNLPSALTNPATNGEMIIVTHRDWLTQANEWADYRRGQGMSVAVVDIDDIFDEFSYGSVSTAALTNFFQYAKNNWQGPPSYVLIIGDASYDFRNYENRAFQSFVPTRLVDTLFEETGSDEALCDFNNDGLAEIAIGRIPARSAQTVTQLLAKTVGFESSVGQAPGRGALCVSDSANDYDFEGVCSRLSGQLPPSIPSSLINRGQTDSRTLMLNSLNAGKYLVNYVGHGSVGVWANNSFFSIADGTSLTNAPNYSIFMTLTCLNGYFLNPNDGLAESLLKAPNGGAAATWASTGRTTPDMQEIMAARFYSQIGAGNMIRLGDLIRDAKQALVFGRDVRLSWTLLGDPALKVR